MDASNLLKFIFLLCCLLLTAEADHSNNEHKVIIIGAGASGIAAASMLMENGVEDLWILEAEDRIGGRIYSVPMGDVHVEMGAQWIHGMKDNIVYKMVKDLNLTVQASKYSDMYLSNGHRLDKQFAEEVWNILLDFNEIDGKGYYNKTAENEFRQSFLKAINKRWGDQPKKLEVAKEALPLMEMCMNANYGAFNYSDISVQSEYEECEGEHRVWKGMGYKIILDILMKKFPDPKKELPIMNVLSLKKRVAKIDRSSESKITVECDDGTVRKADYVIFTPSLGVLKEQHRDLFVPELPEEKQRVIEKLGFGGVAKIILQFSEAWWPNDTTYGFAFIWTDKDRQEVRKEFPNAFVGDTGKTWLEGISGFFKAPQFKKDTNIIIGWVTGETVKHVEALTDDEVRAGSLYLLKTFVLPKTSRAELPELKNMRRSKWYNNKNFRGAYSYDSVQRIEPGIRNADLGIPVGKLLFAGEATNANHYSTVHGAIESGQREARRILEAIKK